MSARPCGRPGRHLGVVPTSVFLDNLPGWVRALIKTEWSLMPTTRPYLARNGTVTARLVLRRRAAADTLVFHWTVRGPFGDAMLDALLAAMPPPSRGCAPSAVGGCAPSATAAGGAHELHR